MQYRIVNIKRDEILSEEEAIRGGFDFLYVEVEFIKAGQVVHRNDFRMQIRKQYHRYSGKRGPDGEILEPEKYEAYDNDVAAEIRSNIERYLKRMDKVPFDNRDMNIKTSDGDPLGLRSQAVLSLVGELVEWQR